MILITQKIKYLIFIKNLFNIFINWKIKKIMFCNKNL